jgi:type IV pilus assembly protein PilM
MGYASGHAWQTMDRPELQIKSGKKRWALKHFRLGASFAPLKQVDRMHDGRRQSGGMTGKVLGSFMRKGFFRRKADSVLGVDIHEAGIKLIELGRSATGYTIEGYATQGLSAHAVVDGTLLDLEGIGQALRQALARLRTSVRQAAVAVVGPSVITRVIEMDAGLSDEEMVWMIQMEADQYIPYPLDDVAIDFQVRGPSIQDPRRVEVLLAACLKEQVEARAAVLVLAGLVPQVVDIEGFALERASRQDFASFTPGHRVDGAQWAVDAQEMEVACGLALRSFAG